jgi:hypothetical protein
MWEIRENHETIMKITEKKKLQIQVSLDHWVVDCSNINDWIKEANKWCYDLWDLALDVMEDYDFPHAGPIKQDLPN